MYPAEWELEAGEMVGAEAVYHQLKAWLPQPDDGGASKGRSGDGDGLLEEPQTSM
jgi:hypothetical protein